MGDGTKDNPYTREDVLRLIEENVGKAKGLDLSGKVFERGINLNGLNLRGILLWGAHLELASLGDAHLEGAILRFANLKGADLADAHLEGAVLFDSDLEGTHLMSAHLEGAYLAFAKFSPDTRLENVDWGNYILGEERSLQFGIAADTYRQLKMWHTNAGIYDIAGKFFFREMTARRKAMKWWPKPWNRAFSKLLSMLSGYGEKPEKVIVWAESVILFFALIYFAIGMLEPNTFPSSLYYSAVSFTALGYGKWAPEPTGWGQGLGVFEAFIGVFSMALFLVTFTRKMTR